jgi:hypothetical protein
MNPTTEDRLISSGCFVTTITTIVCSYIGLAGRFEYWAVAAGCIPLGICLFKFRESRLHKTHLRLLDLAFEDYEHGKPTLEEGGHYGFPTFTLIFASRAKMRIAEEDGRIDRFREHLQHMYGHLGRKDNRFNAHLAVSITSDNPAARPRTRF